MPFPVSAEIYMIKKSAAGLIVSFRLGSDHGVKGGLRLTVVNEEGFRVGEVMVLSCTETESEALVSGGSGVKLGCQISVPSAAATP